MHFLILFFTFFISFILPLKSLFASVEIEYQTDSSLSYSDRRSHVTTLWSLSQNQYLPSSFKSQIDGNSYSNLFGNDSIPLNEFSFFFRKQLRPFDLGLGLSYASGELSDRRVGDLVTLSLALRSLAFGVWLSDLYDEPYVVPFALIYISDSSLTEKDSLLNQSFNVTGSIWSKIGLHLQLSPLEPDVAKKAIHSIGLQNSFIDFYLLQGVTAPSQPNILTSLSWGMGLTLEF